MKLLMFSASLRKDSVNKKLINLTTKLVPNHDLVDFSEFCAPLYNQDIQDSKGFPKEIENFVERLSSADGLIISSPEYNYSTPGTLKNLIDWVSRINPMPWRGAKILLMSASPSLVGGNRGLWATRVPLEGCGAFVYPDMYSLASAYDAFDSNGQLKDEAMQKGLEKIISGFIDFVRKKINEDFS